MTERSSSSYLENAMLLLIKHFGLEKVRRAFEKVLHDSRGLTKNPRELREDKTNKKTAPNILLSIQQLQSQDPERYQLLSGFYVSLKEKSVLPESQDIRQFAQVIGIKEISGKSRKDMIPPLMRTLIDRKGDRLRNDIKVAGNISEQQRKEGFSVITDKLLSGM